MLVALCPAAALACDASGAFGIGFGDKARLVDKKLRQTEAAIVYSVRSPRPDPRFEHYEVNVDARSKTVFQVSASHRITPPMRASDPPMPEAEREAAVRRARDFAAAYITSLPQPMRDALVDEYDTGSWTGMVSPHVELQVIGGFAWEVEVICQDQRRAGQALKAVW